MPLVSVSLLTGIGYALVGPLLSVFLIKELNAGPFEVGAFLLISALGSIVVSTAVGRLSDSRPIRRTLLLVASVAGVVAWVLFAFVREYWVLLVVSVSLGSVSASQMPQMFAYARHALDRSGSTKVPLVMSGLRTLVSIAWVAGPPLGALLMTGTGFTGLFTATAACYVLAAAVISLWLPELGRAEPAPTDTTADR
ncbi:MFS transporter, partial [Actinosynnema sp. NPDC059797]